MAKTLDARDLTIQKIFAGDYQFEIPQYQRPYAWKTEQTEELFNDLVSAMREAKAKRSANQYFMGSIVLIKEEMHPKAFVVDGQQRLTTVTILLAALREKLPEAANDITRFIYKEGSKSLGETNEYRLTARVEDADFFRTYIQEPQGIGKLVTDTRVLSDSQLHYRENATLLLEKTGLLEEEERKAFWQFLAKECSLVIISTPDFESAYRIFSVLNNRGLYLAPIDILKAEILGDIHRSHGEVQSKEYAKKWSEIEKTLGRLAFNELFAHVRTIYAKRKQYATLVKEFKEYVNEYQSPIILIDEVILPYAAVWSFMRHANFAATSHAEIVNDYLVSLNRIEFKDWVPPALIYGKRFYQHPEMLADFFSNLERLTYFLLVTKAGINERIETYAKLTKEIEAEEFDGAVASLSTLTLSYSQEKEFIAALDGDIYRRLPKARLALIFLLESLVSDGSKTQEFKHVSIEHILPQTPLEHSTWLEWFPDEEERELWTHRLANLIPLHFRKNPAAGNREFSYKKEKYFNGKNGTPFVLTTYVTGQSEWSMKDVAKRQEELLSLLCTYWNISGRQQQIAA